LHLKDCSITSAGHLSLLHSQSLVFVSRSSIAFSVCLYSSSSTRSIIIPAMAAPRLFRPTARLFSSRLASTTLRPAVRSACAPSILRRGYATENGTKEVTVRDALNEALAEELELNQKTFVLGEEVAQYNGA
jgi:hypothetical protein